MQPSDNMNICHTDDILMWPPLALCASALYFSLKPTEMLISNNENMKTDQLICSRFK